MAGRELKVLTRAEGVRTENPLFKMYGDKYYTRALGVRTPELRKEADNLLGQEYAGSSVDKASGESAPTQTGSPATHTEGNF